MLGNNLQQTTSADDIFRWIFLGALRVNQVFCVEEASAIQCLEDLKIKIMQSMAILDLNLLFLGPKYYQFLGLNFTDY